MDRRLVTILSGHLRQAATTLAQCVVFAGSVWLALPAFCSEDFNSFRPELEGFISEMVDKHRFDRNELERIFSNARFRQSIITAISRPASAKPWHEYRPLFVNARRIGAGLMFWDSHAEALSRARQDYAVPEEVIVGILGVETLYGAQIGQYRVLDALTTLAFDYPRRADFFKGELEEYLLLMRETGMDALNVRGSYAGAMGIPQFMPSSYRRYAVDFDGNGKRDLWRDAIDAIGSVANYLKTYGWEAGEPVAVQARVTGEEHRALLAEGVKPQRSVAQLRQFGVMPVEEVPEGKPAVLIELETSNGAEYWLGFENFYVITRYNRSVNYGMAVIQLGQEIRALRRHNKNYTWRQK